MQDRRFSGVSRLYGAASHERFRHSRIAVVGLGGVGSWAAEALARTGIGHLTLIDLDAVALSNTNRQIQALDGNYGKAKIDAMCERIQAINPACQVSRVEDFVTVDNVGHLLACEGNVGYDFVVDAIDQTRVKAAIIAWCCHHDVPVVTSGGAGGRTDPSLLRCSDLSMTTQDALLSRVRSQLRKDYGFPSANTGGGKSARPGKKFGVPAIFSVEPLQRPDRCQHEFDSVMDPLHGGAGLSCAGYGSSVVVTASAGFMAAAVVLNRLAVTL